jgi:hypothetical protein
LPGSPSAPSTKLRTLLPRERLMLQLLAALDVEADEQGYDGLVESQGYNSLDEFVEEAGVPAGLVPDSLAWKTWFIETLTGVLPAG